MLRRRPAARADQRRRRGEDHLCAVRDRGVHRRRRLALRFHAVEGLHGDLLAHDGLQILPPDVVRAAPVAFLRHEVADERDAQMLGEHALDDAPEHAGRLARLLRADGDRLVLRGDLNIRPDRAQALDQLRAGDAFKRLKGVDLEPDQQRVGDRDAERLAVQLAERLLEADEAGDEPAALFLRPDVLRLITKRGLQLRKPLRTAEGDLIEPRQLPRVQELVIREDRRLLRPDGEDAGHIRGDRRRVVALEHADALVALLHIPSCT